MQLELPPPELEPRLFEILRRIVDVNGHKQVASALGFDESALSHALSRATSDTGKRKRYIPIDRLPSLVMMRGGDELVGWLASLISCAIVERIPVTAEEELAAIKDVIRTQLGDGLRKEIKRATRVTISARRGYALGGGR